MQITPTGQITSEAQVQAIVSGAQTPMQVTADTQVAANAKNTVQTMPIDRVNISAQAQALARGEVNETSGAESIETQSVQSAEGGK